MVSSPGESTTVRATVYDEPGHPHGGKTVTFAKDNACAESSLSPTSATTDVVGVATTTLIVCSAAFTTIDLTTSAALGGTTLVGSVTVRLHRHRGQRQACLTALARPASG